MSPRFVEQRLAELTCSDRLIIVYHTYVFIYAGRLISVCPIRYQLNCKYTSNEGIKCINILQIYEFMNDFF